MSASVNAGIIGVGMSVPDRVLSNADLEKLVDTSDEWIMSRTGIRERRMCAPDETSATLGAAAARRALQDAGMEPAELDLIICSTATGDYIWPATACVIQAAIGAGRCPAFDLSAACSGFVYGLATAAASVKSGQMRNALIVGVDTLTKQINWEDRGTCILFGDGAAAAVIAPCAADEGILATSMGADGTGLEQIILPAGGTKMPVTPEVIEKKLNCIQMRGAEVFKFAVKIMVDACVDALYKAGLTPQDVDLFIPHQANIRIINAAAERMGLAAERVFTNVDRYGNTSAASIGIAMREALDQGLLRRGSVVVTVGFGAGLTWAANVIRWSRDEEGARTA
jgi:3-oxoacyl-[acyl-carrier-protein] synthase-3